ncbi:MAG TPA: hypothetical protein VMQ51_06450 [Candidatus Binatia bacterium]|nr:hypothetical protein [Candidatus Binatia bacterium]
MDGLLVREGSPLFDTLGALAREARLVFFAGLPGTGKSLLIHQLAHLAHARGRRVHLLQWDVARPVFEASRAGRRHPQVHGVTHGVIRLAVGRWAREAVARWHARHPGLDHLLIGETPFIGHRLIALARTASDDAEPVLAAESTRFVIPVPSRDLREHLEGERERRTRDPRHPREREDAPPAVLRALWRELFEVARKLGIADRSAEAGYDPEIYRRVYERLLVHRHALALPLDTVLPVSGLSAYDFKMATSDVLPTGEEASWLVEDTQTRYPHASLLDIELADWYRV